MNMEPGEHGKHVLNAGIFILLIESITSLGRDEAGFTSFQSCPLVFRKSKLVRVVKIAI